jgi:predicted RNA-binding Zn ribbon-like protein
MPVPQPGGRTPAPAPLDLVQDFVNTEIPEWAQDDLATPAALGDWLRRRGLLPAGELPDALAFVHARSLRAALRALALAHTRGVAPDAESRAVIDDALGAFPFAAGLGEGGTPRVVPAGDGMERALGAIVAAMLDAEQAGSWVRLKACRKESCGWVFFDHSRNRSSNWCSMTICGNRTKTTLYRRRRNAGA